MATQGWHKDGYGDMWGKEQHRETWRDSKGIQMVEKERTEKRRRSGEYFDEWILKAYASFWKVRTIEKDRTSKTHTGYIWVGAQLYRNTGNNHLGTISRTMSLRDRDFEWAHTASRNCEVTKTRLKVESYHVMTKSWRCSIIWYHRYKKHGCIRGYGLQMTFLWGKICQEHLPNVSQGRLP